MSTSRIFLPFQSGAISRADGPTLFIGAKFDPALDLLSEVDCVQSLRAECDLLEQNNAKCVQALKSSYRLALVNLTRHRQENRARFAQAWNQLNVDGTLVVSGNKTDGVDAFVKEVGNSVDLHGKLAKSHGKVFWITKTASEPESIRAWSKLLIPQKNSDGYFTTPGVFSSGGIDPGSKLLADTFGPHLKGAGADLGAGWGYLSKQVLDASKAVSGIDLYEADQKALDAAKLNIPNKRATFFWSDVRTLGTPTRYDFVVSNPPFHETRKSEPSLGLSFIKAASEILKPKGTLHLVANRQLPYESTLSNSFRRVEKVSETGRFKILRASGPRSGKP